LFGPRRSHSSIPARTKVRPSRAAAVKDGPTWGPPEGLVLDGRLVVPVADALEARDAVLAARDCLAVDDARARGERLDDERETVG